MTLTRGTRRAIAASLLVAYLAILARALLQPVDGANLGAVLLAMAGVLLVPVLVVLAVRG